MIPMPRGMDIAKGRDLWHCLSQNRESPFGLVCEEGLAHYKRSGGLPVLEHMEQPAKKICSSHCDLARCCIQVQRVVLVDFVYFPLLGVPTSSC